MKLDLLLDTGSFKKEINMKICRIFLSLTLLVASMNVFASLIENGDFATCDFSSWEKDTDGFGDVSSGNDFAIYDNGKACSAAISVDYYSPDGDPFGIPVSEAFFANTLYQELNFTGGAGSTFELTIDLLAVSESDLNNPLFIPDYFFIGLNDGFGNYYDETGSLGFLVSPTDINAFYSNSFVFNLDSSFLNQSGWYLDFQLNIGWDDQTGLSDAFGTTIFVNSVSMTEVKSYAHEVPEPSTIPLLFIGLAGLRKYKSITKF